MAIAGHACLYGHHIYSKAKDQPDKIAISCSWSAEQGDLFLGNGQKRELPVLFGQKRMYPENNSGRECCWPYLIGQHPLFPVLGKKRPGTPGNIATLFSFHPFLAILWSFPVGYSTTRTDQHGPQDLNVLTFFPPDWGMLRRSRCIQIFL